MHLSQREKERDRERERERERERGGGASAKQQLQLGTGKKERNSSSFLRNSPWQKTWQLLSGGWRAEWRLTVSEGGSSIVCLLAFCLPPPPAPPAEISNGDKRFHRLLNFPCIVRKDKRTRERERERETLGSDRVARIVGKVLISFSV
jgi:hypothetical protein